ncbi:hypothetical protein B0H11DRAFT_2415430 [Mycena galericulata]|nr:hypothetical protein B0H11DRAFT_2415430 [Mycena galericulata]
MPMMAGAPTPTPSPRRQSQNCFQVDCKQAGNGLCVQKFCKSCCVNTSVLCGAPRHNYQPPVVYQPEQVISASSASRPFENAPVVRARAYAQPISATYATKLQHGDFSVTDLRDRAQVESYRMMADRQIKTYWFFKDDTPPHSFVCPVPNFPFFHPRDDVAIVTIVGEEKCNPYNVYLNGEWTITTSPQRVKANDTLCFKSLEVTVCKGGPFAGNAKRRLSTGSDEKSPSPNPSPTKIVRCSSGESISTKTKNLQLTTRAEDIISLSSDDENEPSSSQTSKYPGRHAKNPATPELPSLKNKRTLPLKWACEMDKGFRAMENGDGKVPDQFSLVFSGCKWASSNIPQIAIRNTEYPGEADIPLAGSLETVISVGQAIFSNISEGGIALFCLYTLTVHKKIDSELFPLTMAIIKPQKSRTIQARDKNPPSPSKSRGKPGPKPKNGLHTVARFDSQALYMEDHSLSQKQVVANLDLALPVAGHLNKFRSPLTQEVEESKAPNSFLKNIFIQFMCSGIIVIWNTLGALPDGIPYEQLYCISIRALGTLSKRIPFSREYLHDLVANHSLTLDNLKEIIKIFLKKQRLAGANNPTTTTHAIEFITNANVTCDWAYVADITQTNEALRLENYIRTLVDTDNVIVPAEYLKDIVVKPKHNKKTLQVLDPKADVRTERPKLIVLDYTDSKLGDTVEMHRFNTLKIDLYKNSPTHLRPSQVALPEASTWSANTVSVLNELFDVWKPIKSGTEEPFIVSYALPTYSSDEVKLLRAPHGMDLSRSKWVPKMAEEYHYIPVVSPINALRVMIIVRPMSKAKEGKGPPHEPEAPPAVAAPQVEAPKKSKGEIFLRDKYGEATTALTQAAGGKKGSNKSAQPLSILVSWIRDVDNILKNHENKRVSTPGSQASKKSMKKFTQKDFEGLFGRRWAWLESCQIAAEAMRSQRAIFADDLDKLAAFKAFLADAEPKHGLGILTFIERVENFGERYDEEEQEKKVGNGNRDEEENGNSSDDEDEDDEDDDEDDEEDDSD